jgi:hypothetical protein
MHEMLVHCGNDVALGVAELCPGLSKVAGHRRRSPPTFQQKKKKRDICMSFIQVKQNKISWDKFLQIPANFEIISQQI